MTVSPPATVSALAGMHDASNRLDVAAHNIANANIAPSAPLRPDGITDSTDTPDLPTEMVAVATAPIVYAANAQVVRAANTMQGSLLDVVA
jgi:flagellar basal body rod protein FlgC